MADSVDITVASKRQFLLISGRAAVVFGALSAAALHSKLRETKTEGTHGSAPTDYLPRAATGVSGFGGEG